jgi:hypothetical protein
MRPTAGWWQMHTWGVPQSTVIYSNKIPYICGSFTDQSLAFIPRQVLSSFCAWDLGEVLEQRCCKLHAVQKMSNGVVMLCRTIGSGCTIVE